MSSCKSSCPTSISASVTCLAALRLAGSYSHCLGKVVSLSYRIGYTCPTPLGYWLQLQLQADVRHQGIGVRHLGGTA